ncbi:TRAP transporter substrate-binding protein [Seohaeicola zhoushanensis]|uniref:TRAP transporter substrate-binding protein n=1 Tax=Seohaeicola zhoushanensis TaxID=1569283 RepID=A0A8J3MA90_9RHOB|nr:TRAP transporter substrate-binding protein [Seohaeicola zhoushanensis]GHF72194.1 hypothetical protein GCM10017056_48950 [Seohaeicola zhoushanensis]
MYMKSIRSLILSSAVLIGTLSTADAETLVISSWAPPTHVLNAEAYPAFIKLLEEVTNGEVTAELKLGLAPPPAQADLVMDGAADITHIFHGYTPGRYPAAELAELPGYQGGAEALSGAYWRAYEKYLKDTGMHQEFKLLALVAHGPATLFSVDKVNDLAAIRGMKVRVPGGVGSEVMAELGATGIQVPANKVYETLSAKAADGVTLNIDARQGFNLNEVAPYMYEVPGGFYRGSFAILMNRAKWDSLSPEVQKAIDEKITGETLSRLWGKIWDESDSRVHDEIPADNLVSASTTDVEAFKAISDVVSQSVFAKVEAATGLDAMEVRDFIAEQTVAIESEK